MMTTANLTINDKTYTMELDLKSICALEAKSARSWGQILIGIRAQSLTPALWLLWGALQAKYAAEFTTIEQVADLFEPAGVTQGIASISTAVAELLNKIYDAGQSSEKDAER
jgi:hypothetical protein